MNRSDVPMQLNDSEFKLMMREFESGCRNGLH